MSSILFENFLLWTLIGGSLAIAGFAVAQGLAKRVYLFAGVGLGAATIALGAILVFAVDTPRKAIKRTVYGVEAALRNNDPAGVSALLASNSLILRRVVENELPHVKIERANVSEFKIEEINMTTAPPRAKVSCRGTLVGNAGGDYPFTAVERFQSIELRLEQDGVWRITDKLEAERGF